MLIYGKYLYYVIDFQDNICGDLTFISIRQSAVY
jgi:hypothetical protein